MTHDIECPYCGEGLDINHDDGQGYEEGINHQQQCIHCDKNFTFTTTITFSYEAEKADCLNDGEHIWKPTSTYPRCYTNMQCESCGEYRKPTEEEKIKYNIPSQNEFFKQLNNHANANG